MHGVITSTMDTRSGADDTSKDTTMVTMKKTVLKALFMVSALLPLPEPMVFKNTLFDMNKDPVGKTSSQTLHTEVTGK